jgi:hypothetical protein
MLRCDICDEPADPADLLTGRTAPESSDRLVLTADAVVAVVVVIVVAGPDTDTGADAPRAFPDDDDDPPLLDLLRLNQPRQLMSPAHPGTGYNSS